MLYKRILSAILGIVLTITFIFFGSLPFFIFVIILAVLAAVEYERLLPVKYKNNRLLLPLFSIIVISSTYLTNRSIINFPVGVFFSIILFTLYVHHIITSDSTIFLQQLGFNLTGIIYLGTGFSFIILLRDFSIQPFDMTKALWLVLLATWAEDTGAYFIGRYLGRTTFFKKSPNKTLEGAAGGIIFTIIVVFIYIEFISTFSIYWLLYSILVALVAMTGDLFESSIKRFAGVKDSGSILPGHGGILDRFDSLLFSAPFTYYFLQYIL